MATSNFKKPVKKTLVERKKKATQINFKAIGILGIGLTLFLILFVLLKSQSNTNIKKSAITQAKESEDKNEFELALRHLDRYLADNPDDIQVLEAKAGVLANPKMSLTADRILQAIQVLDQLIRIDPDGDGRLATRRRLIELYIAYGELVRLFADDLNDGRIEAKESRYLAAVEAADELIRYKDKKTGRQNGEIDGASHRLKAMAYMGQVPGLVAKNPDQSLSLDEAEKELDKALAIDPGDIDASEKLAELYMIHRQNPVRFAKTLDRMLESLSTKKYETEEAAKRAALRVRLARFRAFFSTKDLSKAQIELDAALQIAPKNVELLGSAAGLALQRNETQECRRYLDLIPAEFQKDNLRVRLLRGELEFAERHPDEAIDQWRKGLSLVGGGDQDLTWRLAANLIHVGRLVEAKPLIDQYLRLAKPGDPKGMYLEGLYAEKSGHINRAIELMSKSSLLVPTVFKSDVLMALGHCYELIGDESKAMYTYKSAVNLGGAATAPRRAMARLYLGTDPNRAIEELETAYAASMGKSSFEVPDSCKVVLLKSTGDRTAIPSSGSNEFIVASIDGVLHFRLFGLDGKIQVDTDESRLKDKGSLVRELREGIQNLWPPHRLTQDENKQTLVSLSRVVQPTPKDIKGDPNILIDLIKIKLDRQMKLAKADRDFREIAKLLADAKEIAPQNPAIQGLIAQYQSYENRLDLAAKTLENTVKGANRKRPEAWLAYAETLELLGRLTDALNVLDEGSTPEAAGDHAVMRSMKARLLLKTGQGVRAKEILTTNLDSIPKPEQAELCKARGDLLQELGDRPGAREAYIEWSEKAPESPFPALKLLSIAQLDGNEETAKLGLESLAKLGRDNEPYGLAAKALQWLRVDPAKPGPVAPERLIEAEKLVEKLNTIAPDFPVKYMIQGMILENRADPGDENQWRATMRKAAEAYRKSIKIGTSSPALPKLIEIYMRLNDNDKLNLLKLEYDDSTRRLKTEISVEFDRLSMLIAMKLNDKKRAQEYLDKLWQDRPENRDIGLARAQNLLNNGQVDDAEATLVELTRMQPQDPLPWLELIQFKATRRSPADVTRAIEQARQRYTGVRPTLFLAQCYFFAKDLPNAVREFQKAYDLEPNDLTTIRALIQFREAINQVDEVESLLRKVLKIDPNASWAARNLALVLSARPTIDAWNEAWALVAPGNSQVGDLPEDRLVRATVLARSQVSMKRVQAIPAFASLANDLPISNRVGIEARIRLAQAMLDTDNPAEAWTYINPLCDDLTRSNVVALRIGIEALCQLGKGDEAEKRLLRLSSAVPSSQQLVFLRAWVLHAKKKDQEASRALVELFDKVEKSPEGEQTGSTCLDLLLKFRDLDSALTLAQRMSADWPRQAGNLARVQVARKEYDAALISCRTALEQGAAREGVQQAAFAAVARQNDKEFLNKVEDIMTRGRSKMPKDIGMLVHLATLRHVQQRYEDELVFYRMALEMKPTNRQFVNNMAWTLSEGLDRANEAYQQIEDVIVRDGEAAEFLDTRGVIQIRRKNYSQAIEDLEKSVKLSPSPLTYFHLARAYYKSGNIVESHRCRDEALARKLNLKDLDPTDKTDLAEVMGKP